MSTTLAWRLIERLRFVSDRCTERGASVIEYALLVALIAVVCVGAVTFLGEEASTLYTDATEEMFLATP
jgi:Flp pilus assembly pilin Flp